MRKLPLLLALLLPARAHAIRAIMEQTAASNNTIFVATQTTQVGIGNAAPAATLDVTGNAQFGTTAKSTFSTSGALVMASGSSITLTGSNGFISLQSSITTSGGFFGNGAGLTGSITGANISGGAAGQILYQSGAGATAKLTAGGATQLLGGGAALPAWSVLSSTYIANITGNAAFADRLNATPTQCSAGNAPRGVDNQGNAQNCTAVPSTVITWSSQTVASTAVSDTILSVGKSTITLASLPANAVVDFKFTGNVKGSGTGGDCGLGVLVDGKYVGQESASIPASFFTTPGNNFSGNLGFTQRAYISGSGNHSFTLTAAQTGSITCTICGSGANGFASGSDCRIEALLLGTSQ